MSEQSNNAGLGNVAYVVRSVEGATAIARGNITNSKMSDRPTPETDALILLKDGFGATDYEWREHSRRLERERDEARERCAKFRNIAERAVNLGLGGGTGRINGILSVKYFKGIIKAAFKGKTK